VWLRRMRRGGLESSLKDDGRDLGTRIDAVDSTSSLELKKDRISFQSLIK